ncbi:hypothetical protein [Geodermatophilus sp. CPCC 205761]|uniref:hypothetical protein n=1 Tax=Geodermatophilus sp. CPCC 205761 TaxID=2936597 RepID=UPI003EEA8D96
MIRGLFGVSVVREVCPFHADDDVRGVPTGYGDGSLAFACTRRGHPLEGPHTWLRVPAVEAGPSGSGLAAELGLATELPAAVKAFAGRWVEYGLVERAYAARRPTDFAHLVSRFGHTALVDKRNTASAFLAGYLATLAKRGDILYHDGPATGRWSYNSKISWWAVAPRPQWDDDRLSWAAAGCAVDYVPGVAAADDAQAAYDRG